MPTLTQANPLTFQAREKVGVLVSHAHYDISLLGGCSTIPLEGRYSRARRQTGPGIAERFALSVYLLDKNLVSAIAQTKHRTAPDERAVPVDRKPWG
jgi:hypothetical protein